MERLQKAFVLVAVELSRAELENVARTGPLLAFLKTPAEDIDLNPFLVSCTDRDFPLATSF
jgi:hypothetical protein